MTLLIVLLFSSLALVAQRPVSQVEITRYLRTQYAAGIQNWAFTQDKNGRIYIANNEGLLVYNGTNWQLFPVPNKTIVRSIAFAADGKLYAGAQDEFGFYLPDKAGLFQYTSLKNLLPEKERSFADVWDVKTDGKNVFFRTDYKIFCLADNHISVFSATSAWLPLFKHNGSVIAQDSTAGLLYFRNGSWQTLIEKNKLPSGLIVTDAVPFGHDTSLVCTRKSGLLLLTGNTLIKFPVSATVEKEQFTCLATQEERGFLAGTYSNGIYIINRQGVATENINTESGLQNNTVRSLFSDHNGNTWTALDNGIAFLPYSNAIRHVNPPAFNNGSGYGVSNFNGSTYFALSTGIMALPTIDITSIYEQPSTILNGLTWNLSAIDDHLFAGRDDGLWEIRNGAPKMIADVSGFWTCRKLAGSMAAGNYRGIHFFESKDGNFTDAGSLENFSESSRYLETDENNIWISHPYRGIYRIRLPDHSITLYSRKKGLPNDLDNHVFKIKNKILFATLQGIYEYDEAGDRIIPSKEYSSLFGNLSVRYLKEDEKGNIWFVHEKMIGVVDFSGPKPVINYIPELKNKILSGFENVYPYDVQNVWIGAESGFFHVNYEKYKRSVVSLKPYITMVQITSNGDSILYGGYSFDEKAEQARASIPYKWNSLRFTYAASAYGQQPVEYSYFLKGFDKNWSSWGSRTEKDYTNLPEGTYTFMVRARRGPSSSQSEEVNYTFIVSAPWYRTLWAYLLYSAALFLLLYVLFRYQERKHRLKQEFRRKADQEKYEEEQKQMAFQHQLELEKTEKELIKLRNENLEVELENKNVELASSAMSLIQKKEFLLKITEELNKLYKPGKEQVDASDLKKVLRSLTSDDKLDEEWKQFSMHFNKVHGNFLLILKKKYPQLNAHELKLCAYLRLNLSSKEMARLMSISVRGVEIGRYRLRKKLQLQPKEDLFQFLLGIESTEGTTTGEPES